MELLILAGILVLLSLLGIRTYRRWYYHDLAEAEWYGQQSHASPHTRDQPIRDIRDSKF